MNNQETYERIEKYLSGQMNAAEKDLFDKEMQSDPELREWVALNRHIDKSIADEGADKLAEVLRKVDQERFEQGGGATVRPLWMRYAMAAAVALLVVAGGFYLLRPGPSVHIDSAELFASNFEPYASHYTLRSNTSRDSVLQKAFDQYSNRKYKEALPGFRTALEDSASDLRVKFYMAMCHMALNQPREALPLLEEVTHDGSTPFQDPARWYQGLSYLQMDRLDEAVTVFKELSRGEGKYARQAGEILKTL